MTRRLLFKLFFIVIICVVFPFKTYLQTNSENDIILKNLKIHTDNIFRLNDLLVNGKLYRPLNSNANGSPYFQNNKLWRKSKLFIKGTEFSDQNILYDIENDELIANIIYPDGNTKNIVLDQELIDSLWIEDHFFINITPFTKENINGIYEQVYDGRFKALIKHHVTYKRVIDYNAPNGYYDDPEISLFILTEKRLIKISNKKSLLSYFESDKKEIGRFIRRNKINLKTASIIEYFNLFKICDDLSTK